MSVTVGVIDNHQLILHGVRAWLAGSDDLDVVNTALTFTDYLQGAAADVVLLDLRLEDGTVPADNVRALVGTGSAVIIVSSFGSHNDVIDAIEAGANGYLLKTDDTATLADAIRNAARGDIILSTELAFILSRDARSTRPKLSPQERRSIELYGSGAELAAVARRMQLQPSTIRQYLTRAYEKYAALGRTITNRSQLTIRLYEDGILPEPPP